MSDQQGSEDPTNSPVPEPLTLAIVGSGLIALALYTRRRQLRVQEE